LPAPATYGPSPPVEYEDDITKSLDRPTARSNTPLSQMTQKTFSSPLVASINAMAPPSATQPPTPDSGRKRNADDFEEDTTVEDGTKDFTLLPSSSPSPISTQKTLFPASPRPSKRQRTIVTTSSTPKSKTLSATKHLTIKSTWNTQFASIINQNAFYFAHIDAAKKAKKEGLPEPASARRFDPKRDYVKNPLQFPLAVDEAMPQYGGSTTRSPKIRQEVLTTPKSERQRRAAPKVSKATKVEKAPKTPKAPKVTKSKAAPKKVVLEDWRRIEDVTPPISSLDRHSPKVIDHAKVPGYKPRDVSQDVDSEFLHPLEAELCTFITLRPDKYLRLKRQIFLSFVEVKKETPTKIFNKTMAQKVGSLDANKLSIMHQFFENVGWYSREYFPELPADTTWRSR